MRRKGNAKIIPANPDAVFLNYQGGWIKDNSRLKLMEKGRQIGLSWSTAYAADERTAAQGQRNDQWVSSRDDVQARLFLEDCKMWAGIMDLAAQDLGEIVIDPKERSTAYVLQFANGRRINSMSSNPDAQAGKRGGRILDEFALHPDPRKLWSIAYPGITWGGNMEVISTHRGSQNFFNQLVREIKEGGNPKGISLHTVTLQDALDDGFLFKLQQALPEGDERQPMDEAAYYDFVRSGCADEESFQQEYMCHPADDDTAFLEYDLIAASEYPSLTDWRQCEGGRLFAGIDIGRKHDLTVLWVLELLGDVFYTRHIERLQNMRKSDQEKVIWPWIERCERTCIDATGLGIGWSDDAQDQFGEHRVEAVTFTPRVKEALAYPIRSAMEERRLRMPHDPVTRADLRQVTKQVTAAGNIRFTAERTPDGHADHFWSLGLAIHAASSDATEYGYETPSREDRAGSLWRRSAGTVGSGVGYSEPGQAGRMRETADAVDAAEDTGTAIRPPWWPRQWQRKRHCRSITTIRSTIPLQPVSGVQHPPPDGSGKSRRGPTGYGAGWNGPTRAVPPSSLANTASSVRSTAMTARPER